MHSIRTHSCGELRKDHVGQSVRLSGWLHRKRNFGGLMFLDLRDHYGITQVIVQPDASFFETLSRCKPESVLTITGKVVAREASNNSWPTTNAPEKPVSICKSSAPCPVSIVRNA